MDGSRPSASSGRYAWLLWGLVAYLVLVPIAREALPAWQRVLDMLLPLCFVTAVVTLLAHRRLAMAAAVLVALSLALEVAGFAIGLPGPGTAARMLLLLFCLLCTGVVLRDVLLGGPVDLNRLCGAVSGYLLLGLAWALLYALVDRHGAAPAFGSRSGAPVDYLYFSFVTLTTLGFGDIVPLKGVARTLVYMEAVFGQFYLAILVATLVSKLGGAGRRA